MPAPPGQDAPGFVSPLSQFFGPAVPFTTFPPAYAPALQQAGIVGQGSVTTTAVVGGALSITGEGQAGAAAPLVLPYSMGGNAANTGATIAATITTANSSGDCLAAWVTSNNAAPTGVSDPVNGAWAAVGTQVTTGNQIGQWFLLPSSSVLSTSQSVTASFAAANGSKTISVIGCAGLATAPFDASATGTGTSAAPTFTVSGLVQAGELVLMGIASNNAGGSPTFTLPFTGVGSVQHSGVNQFAATGWAVLTGQNNVTGSGAITSAQWGVSAITLQIPGVPGTEVPALSLAGAGSVSTTEIVSTALSVTGAGTVTVPGVLQAALSVSGTGSVTASGVLPGFVSIGGAGLVGLSGVISSALHLTGLGEVDTAALVLAAVSVMGAGSVTAAAVVTVGVIPGSARTGSFPQPSVSAGQYALPKTTPGIKGYGSVTAGGEVAEAKATAVAGQMPLPGVSGA